MNAIQLTSPGTSLVFTYDWSSDVGNGVALVSVVNTLPSGLALELEQIDIPNAQSSVQVNSSVPGIYLCRALATLSDGEVVPDSFTLRVSAAS